LHNGFLEGHRLLAAIGCDLVLDAAATSGLPDEGYLVWIAAEKVDVLLDPF